MDKTYTLCLNIDGEYKNPNFDVYDLISDNQTESYRKRCNKLFQSLLLNPNALNLKNSEVRNIIVNMEFHVVDRDTLQRLKLNEIFNHTSQSLLVYGRDTITFQDMSYETILPLHKVNDEIKIRKQMFIPDNSMDDYGDLPRDDEGDELDSMDMEEPTGAQMIPPPAVKTMVTTKLTEWVPIKEAANEHLTNQDTLKFIERMKEELMEPPSDWDQFL